MMFGELGSTASGVDVVYTNYNGVLPLFIKREYRHLWMILTL